MSQPVVVAIDGPAGAGKSTIARRVAARLGFVYIDSGAMYRAVALWALRGNVNLEDAARLEQMAQAARIDFAPGGSTVFLNGENVSDAIRTPEVSQAASKVSALPGVRRALVEKQRQMGATQSVVMEGRDIGSVVFRNADVKIFLDADPAARAQRRALELEEKGETASPEDVARELAERDRRDSTRATAPLVQAPGAVRLDTTRLSIEEVEQVILGIISQHRA
ncbi:MAG: (d)CMP kinase [Armatimonadota bacterium]|nr:(d)CMP kinase [Armatimonadota bacterium]